MISTFYVNIKIILFKKHNFIFNIVLTIIYNIFIDNINNIFHIIWNDDKITCLHL